MIDRDDIYEDEILLYKPTEKKKKPKKSKHKHIYSDCVYEVVNPYGKLDSAHGFIATTEKTIGTYCPICGKVGDIQQYNNERWYTADRANHYTFRKIPTEEGVKELDEATRTLPSFVIDDCWQKAVEI